MSYLDKTYLGQINETDTRTQGKIMGHRGATTGGGAGWAHPLLHTLAKVMHYLILPMIKIPAPPLKILSYAPDGTPCAFEGLFRVMPLPWE